MTLSEWKELNKLNWLKVSLKLGIFANRLSRLRNGKTRPTIEEKKALLELTGNEVDDFRD